MACRSARQLLRCTHWYVVPHDSCYVARTDMPFRTFAAPSRAVSNILHADFRFAPSRLEPHSIASRALCTCPINIGSTMHPASSQKGLRSGWQSGAPEPHLLTRRCFPMVRVLPFRTSVCRSAHRQPLPRRLPLRSIPSRAALDCIPCYARDTHSRGHGRPRSAWKSSLLRLLLSIT